jgi:hypothetical protein
MGEGLLGALGGGILGGIGGFFSSRARKKAAARFKRNQQIGITQARANTEQRVQALLDNPLISAASSFIQESFAGDGGPLADQLSKRLRVAQEARGLRRSTAGAVAEASSLAAFRQNFLASLLPQAQSFGTLGERFRGGILQQELPIQIGFNTGAPIPGVSAPSPQLQDPTGFDPISSVLSGGTSGGIGGFQVGSEFSRISSQNDFLESLRKSGNYSTPDSRISSRTASPNSSSRSARLAVRARA